MKSVDAIKMTDAWIQKVLEAQKKSKELTKEKLLKEINIDQNLAEALATTITLANAAMATELILERKEDNASFRFGRIKETMHG